MLKEACGNFINSKGEILGAHQGIINYTIGQRKGLGISYKVPLFVLDFDKDRNELIVGEEQELKSTEFWTEDNNFLTNVQLNSLIEVFLPYPFDEKIPIISLSE